jgi:hypothetical protein
MKLIEQLKKGEVAIWNGGVYEEEIKRVAQFLGCPVPTDLARKFYTFINGKLIFSFNNDNDLPYEHIDEFIKEIEGEGDRREEAKDLGVTVEELKHLDEIDALEAQLKEANEKLQSTETTLKYQKDGNKAFRTQIAKAEEMLKEANERAKKAEKNLECAHIDLTQKEAQLAELQPYPRGEEGWYKYKGEWSDIDDKTLYFCYDSKSKTHYALNCHGEAFPCDDFTTEDPHKKETVFTHVLGAMNEFEKLDKGALIPEEFDEVLCFGSHMEDGLYQFMGKNHDGSFNSLLGIMGYEFDDPNNHRCKDLTR